MNAQKEAIRKKAQAARDKVPKRAEKSQRIADHLFSSTIWKDSSSLSSYISFKSEVDTALIVQTTLSQNKNLYVPKVLSNEEIGLFKIHSLNDLEKGIFGIREPSLDFINTSPVTDYKSLSLILIPGLAFDRSGNRLGFGKGHYDKLLVKLPKTCKKIGLAYHSQLFPQLPSEPFDQKMDFVLTEEGFIHRE